MSDSSGRRLIPIGTRVEFAKTIGESDIYLFAGSPATSAPTTSTPST